MSKLIKGLTNNRPYSKTQIFLLENFYAFFIIMVHRSGTQLEKLQPFRKFLKIFNSF